METHAKTTADPPLPPRAHVSHRQGPSRPQQGLHASTTPAGEIQISGEGTPAPAVVKLPRRFRGAPKAENSGLGQGRHKAGVPGELSPRSPASPHPGSNRIGVTRDATRAGRSCRGSALQSSPTPDPSLHRPGLPTSQPRQPLPHL